VFSFFSKLQFRLELEQYFFPIETLTATLTHGRPSSEFRRESGISWEWSTILYVLYKFTTYLLT